MKLKRIFSAVLALVLVFSLAITAYGVLIDGVEGGGVDGEPLPPQIKISNKKAFPAPEGFDDMEEIVAHLKDNSTGGDISVDGNKLVIRFDGKTSIDEDMDIGNITQGLLHNEAVIKFYLPEEFMRRDSVSYGVQKRKFPDEWVPATPFTGSDAEYFLGEGPLTGIVDDSQFKANTVKCYSNQISNPNPEGEVFLSATDFGTILEALKSDEKITSSASQEATSISDLLKVLKTSDDAAARKAALDILKGMFPWYKF